jgi:hypothetical protein
MMNYFEKINYLSFIIFDDFDRLTINNLIIIFNYSLINFNHYIS